VFEGFTLEYRAVHAMPRGSLVAFRAAMITHGR
jgi:hypothetical protein